MFVGSSPLFFSALPRRSLVEVCWKVKERNVSRVDGGSNYDSLKVGQIYFFFQLYYEGVVNVCGFESSLFFQPYLADLSYKYFGN